MLKINFIFYVFPISVISNYFRLDLIKESSLSILKWPEIMNRKVKQEKELSEYHTERLDAAQQMTGYVSKMMKDYITSDNIWKIVTKTSPVSII